METKKKSWTELLFAYAKNEKKKMLLSVILSGSALRWGLRRSTVCIGQSACLRQERRRSVPSCRGAFGRLCFMPLRY